RRGRQDSDAEAYRLGVLLDRPTYGCHRGREPPGPGPLKPAPRASCARRPPSPRRAPETSSAPPPPPRSPQPPRSQKALSSQSSPPSRHLMVAPSTLISYSSLLPAPSGWSLTIRRG